MFNLQSGVPKTMMASTFQKKNKNKKRAGRMKEKNRNI